MNRKDHYFTILQEECGEVIQASAKCLRFGELDGYPGTDRINVNDLVKELNDILAMVELLKEVGVDLTNFGNLDDIEAKKTKVKKFLEYSRECGRFEE